MLGITAEALFEKIEAYSPSASVQTSSLRQSEPYLFDVVETIAGEIHGNDDFLIEELTDDDLDCSIDLV